ncbi:MAG: glycosyltransferase [Pseudomonadota bacterium]
MTDSPKLLYVLNSFDRGGAEIGLTKLATGGLFDGFDVTIAAIVRGRGGLEKRLSKLGLPAVVFSNREQMSLRDIPSSYVQLSRLISQIRPDIVIGSLPQANIAARLACAFRKKVKYISFEHNTHLAKRAYEIAFMATSFRVDWTFADAKHTLDVALKRFYLKNPELLSIVPLVQFDTPSRIYSGPIDTDKFHFVNTGRFTPVKNQRAIIEAVSILRQRGRDVSLTLYGEGADQADCESLAKELGLTDWVNFPGFVDNWTSGPSDGFILASQHEGLCIVLLEAIHAGIPVIAPIVGGVNDYGNDENILVLASDKPAEIADCIENLISDRKKTALRTKNAAQTLDSLYGRDAVEMQLKKINSLMHAEISK